MASGSFSGGKLGISIGTVNVRKGYVADYMDTVLKNQINTKTGKRVKYVMNKVVSDNFKMAALTGDKNETRKVNTHERYRFAAILYASLLANTPLDEDYEYNIYKKLDNGKYKTTTKKHKANDVRARDHWHCILGEGSNKSIDFSSDKFTKADFSKENSWQKLFMLFVRKQTVKGRLRGFRTIKIYNDLPYFNILEYGMYSRKNSGPWEGDEREHGVKNNYSVQAPNGITRRALAKIEYIATKARKDGVWTLGDYKQSVFYGIGRDGTGGHLYDRENPGGIRGLKNVDKRFNAFKSTIKIQAELTPKDMKKELSMTQGAIRQRRFRERHKGEMGEKRSFINTTAKIGKSTIDDIDIDEEKAFFQQKHGRLPTKQELDNYVKDLLLEMNGEEEVVTMKSASDASKKEKNILAGIEAPEGFTLIRDGPSQIIAKSKQGVQYFWFKKSSKKGWFEGGNINKPYKED